MSKGQKNLPLIFMTESCIKSKRFSLYLKKKKCEHNEITESNFFFFLVPRSNLVFFLRSRGKAPRVKTKPKDPKNL